MLRRTKCGRTNSRRVMDKSPAGDFIRATVPSKVSLDSTNVGLPVAVLRPVGLARRLVAAGLAFGGLGHVFLLVMEAADGVEPSSPESESGIMPLYEAALKWSAWLASIQRSHPSKGCGFPGFPTRSYFISIHAHSQDTSTCRGRLLPYHISI